MSAIDIERVHRRVEPIDGWFLTDEDWLAAGSAFRALATALTRRDEEAVRTALETLQSLEERAFRAEAQLGPEKTPIPPQQREQLNYLVRRLKLELGQPPSPPDSAEGTRSVG
ncbi:CATRA system-associated protein [Streptomyces sp. bgisy027]|uniref:CATRA system-associated protein n=1 Tax=Streptomyces sp. bgisy027 TaxID=3413770 RepID=UPI003D744ADD